MWKLQIIPISNVSEILPYQSFGLCGFPATIGIKPNKFLLSQEFSLLMRATSLVDEEDLALLFLFGIKSLTLHPQKLAHTSSRGASGEDREDLWGAAVTGASALLLALARPDAKTQL